jgi:8-oxo-dGTP diphosphatase
MAETVQIETPDFVGCKLALLFGPDILTYQRDDKPGLPWANMWDLPGGGREGSETPMDCTLRELHEEFGLHLPAARLEWHREYPSITDPSRPSHFFAGRIAAGEIASIRFGDEGQHWQMMPLASFLSHQNAVPELQRRTRIAVERLGWG